MSEANADGINPHPTTTKSIHTPRMDQTSRTPRTTGTLPIELTTKDVWNSLNLINNEQRYVPSYFRDFPDMHPNYTGIQMADQVREDLSIHAIARMEVQLNYNIFKCIKMFLEGYDIYIPERVDGSNMIISRVLGSIWLDTEFEGEIRNATKIQRRLNGLDYAPTIEGKTRQKLNDETLLQHLLQHNTFYREALPLVHLLPFGPSCCSYTASTRPSCISSSIPNPTPTCFPSVWQ